jgi:signal transduction histidine kinase
MAAGRLEIHTETIDLRPFVLDVASEIESLVNEKGLTLSLVMGAALPRIRTDPTHLRQILVNLLGNAVKYTNDGGIVIRTRLVDSLSEAGRTLPDPVSYPANPWIGIQVIDTGIGIHPADQSRIFEEFEQVDAGPRGNSAERGTGLGLAISRRLAGLIGGMVELESEPGKGSTFTLWLPVDPDDLTATSK